MAFFYLQVHKGVEAGRVYELPEGAVSIGRSSQNTVAFHSAEKSVSGHHAIIYNTPGKILLQDLQSTNGTFVNEEQVTERDLATGDVVGFGKSGPRVTLIESAEKMDTSIPPTGVNSSLQTNVKTVDDEQLPPPSVTGASTAKENQDDVTRIKIDQQAQPLFVARGTMEVEKKILDKQIGSSDMHKLLKDGKRLDKIIERGNIGETQVGMLRTMQGVHKKSQRQWLVIVSVVVVCAVLVSSYFAIRAFQYRALIDKATSLEDQLDTYEKKIAAIKAKPGGSTKELQKLVMEFQDKNDRFSKLKSKLATEDRQAFYADPLEETIDGILQRFGETDYHIPPTMIERIKHHIGIYSGRMRKTISVYLQRKKKYFPLYYKVFREKNLPVEFAYISMLESGLDPYITSHAGARGLWQFMPRTARNYKLRVNSHVDERTDPEKSTRAAAEYFRDLVGIFGGKSSVMLAMAAYNAGEGRVMGALKRIDNPMVNRDFWYIYRMGYLAEETNEYIPRMMALMIIAENPRQYGFTEEGTLLAQDEMPDAPSRDKDEQGTSGNGGFDFSTEDFLK